MFVLVSQTTWYYIPEDKTYKSVMILYSDLYFFIIFISGGSYCINFLGTFAELQKATISFVMSVCPHGTTELLLDGLV